MNGPHFTDTVIRQAQATREQQARAVTAAERDRAARGDEAGAWARRYMPEYNAATGVPCGWAWEGALNGKARGLTGQQRLEFARAWHDKRCPAMDLHGRQLTLGAEEAA